MLIKNPCKGCLERSPICHTVCPRYQVYEETKRLDYDLRFAESERQRNSRIPYGEHRRKRMGK
jgi:hypothetical protein